MNKKSKPLTQEDPEHCKLCLVYNKPNKITLRALKEAKNTKGMLRARTVRELFEKLKNF